MPHWLLAGTAERSLSFPPQVPWGAKETVLGMVAWSAAFAGVGLAFIPVLAAIAGPKGFSGLSAADKSLFALVNQVGGV